MNVKLAFDVSRCKIPDVEVKRFEKIIPETHLQSHPLGKELFLFDQYLYNILKYFKNDISTVFVDGVENKEVLENIKRYSNYFKMDVMKKEDGNINYIILSCNDEETLKNAIEEFCDYSNGIEEFYCIIPIEFLNHASEYKNIPYPWNKESFYKEAFGIFLKNLKDIVANIS